MTNGLLWNVNSAGFLILVNDYIVQNTSMNTDEAAFGVTVIGNTIRTVYIYASVYASVYASLNVSLYMQV